MSLDCVERRQFSISSALSQRMGTMMAQGREDDGSGIDWDCKSRLPRFDAELIEFRQIYEECDPEERTKLRTWIEKVKALENDEDNLWQLFLRIRAENEQVDDDGNPTHIGVMESSPSNYLAAINAWDRGEPFAPDSYIP